MKLISIILLLLIAISFTAQAQTSALKNKAIVNSAIDTSNNIYLSGAFKQLSVFVSWNDAISAVLYTDYKAWENNQWATATPATTISSSTAGGTGIMLRGHSADYIPAGKLMRFRLAFASTGCTTYTGKVCNVDYVNEP
jgi:hypothetical protein